MDDSQTKLLDAAGRVFADKGFAQATVREIVAQAGMKNIAAINYYFGDKAALYEAALRHAFHCRIPEAMQAPPWKSDMSPADKLRDLIRVIVERMVAPTEDWRMRFLLREMQNPSAAGANLVRDFIRPIYQLIWSVLREIVPDVDQRKLHLLSFSIVGQCFYHKVARSVIRLVVGDEEQATYTPERIADHVAEFSLRALQQMAAESVAEVRK